MQKISNKGITLIALILTIIVMLILAGVSIQIVVNSNLLNTAKSAKEQTETKYEEEKTFGDSITINGKDYIIQPGGQIVEQGIKKLKIYGNSIQNGTPSPDTPVEIQSVGDYDETTGKYKIPVISRGNNLFTYKSLEENGYIDVLDEETGEFEFLKTSNMFPIYINSKENTVYHISFKTNAIKEQNIIISFYYTDGTYKSISKKGVIGEYVECEGISDTNKTVDYIKFGGSGGLGIGTFFKEIQISETELDTYEPYIEPVTTNIYLDEPLRKVGDYTDYIDFEKGKVIRYVRNINLKIADMNNHDTYPGWQKVDYVLDDLGSGIDVSFGEITQKLDNVSTKNWLRINTKSGTSATIYTITESYNMTQTEWIEKYPDLEVNLMYGLIKKTIEQPIELPNIPTHKGTTVIEIDTEIQPSDVIVEI